MEGKRRGTDRGVQSGASTRFSVVQTQTESPSESRDDVISEVIKQSSQRSLASPSQRSRSVGSSSQRDGSRSPSTAGDHGSEFSESPSPAPTPTSESQPLTSEPNAEDEDTEKVTYSWKNLMVWTDPPKISIFKRLGSYFKSERKHRRHGKHRRRGHKHGQTEEEDEASRKTINTDRMMLLNNVSGSCTSGQLTGILGGSGSGKSLLLNTLSFRGTDQLHLVGDRILNGEEADYEKVSRVLAYVQQEDMFFGTLTVHEHLFFQASLRMSPLIPRKVQLERVEEVIGQFGLRKCKDTVIGITGRIKGISGGEQKRLAFATEILTDPPLLLCDEPTSGLDSFMAYTIVSALKDLARTQNKAVMTTIHQPGTDCYSLFDNLIVLTEGRVAYAGPTVEALDFMASAGYPSPQFFNPAEFLTCTLAIRPEEEEESQEAIDTICAAYEESTYYKRLMELVEASIPDNSSGSSSTSSQSSLVIPCVGPSPYKASFIRQFRVLFRRSYVTFIKDPLNLRIRFLQNLGFGVMIGVAYGKQKLDQVGVQNINGAFFISTAFISFSYVFGVIDSICGELPIVIREHSNGMYSAAAYFSSKILIELPVYTVLSVFVSLLIFYMLDLSGLAVDDTKALVRFILFFILSNNVSAAFGYCIACVTGRVKYAVILAPGLIFPFMLIGGVYMVGESKVKILNWLRHIAWQSWVYHGIAQNQWEGVTGIRCNRVNSSCFRDGTTTGEMVLVQIAASEDSIEECMWHLIMQFFLYMAISFLALMMRLRKRT